MPREPIQTLPPLLTRLDGSGVRVELTDLDLAEEDVARQARDDDVVIGHSMNPAGRLARPRC